MHGRAPDEVAKAWRDRVLGRSLRDPDATTAVIELAYRQAGLTPPELVLWADGPGEALQAVAFLRTPPRVVCRFAFVLGAIGAAVWVGLALAIAGHVIRTPANGDFVTFAATLSIFVIVLCSLRPVPRSPRLSPAPRHREILAWIASLIIIALQPVASAALLYVGTLDLGAVEVLGVLLLAAGFGCLPGLVLGARAYAAYRALPPFLQAIGPGVPVGGQLRRARDEAWSQFRQQILYASRSDSLPTQGRRNAHALAFGDDAAGVFPPDALRRPAVSGGVHLLSDWLARAFEPTPMLDTPLHHLDGIEDATRAAAVETVGSGDGALAFAAIAYHLDRLYPFRGVAVAVWPATRVGLDGEERLHSDHGPALAWRDGTAVYLWHGRPIDADLVGDGERPSLSRIGLERDPNRRRVLIERFGLGRYMLECGAAEMQRDHCGALYRLDQRFDEPILAVRVINHTPHEDGSYEEFWLRVPPSTRTAREAVAWTFGLSPEEYDPVLQS